MGRRRPWAEPAFKSIQRSKISPLLWGDLVKDAQDHEKMREEIVGEVLCNLYLMAAKKIIRPESNPIVTVEKAARQEVKSKGEHEAAHCAPGQVLITGLQPSAVLLVGGPGVVVSDERMMAAARLNALFARTQDLHYNFNYVDSRLEEKGLRKAFEVASVRAVSEGLSKKRTSKLDRDAVLDCFKLYKEFKRDPAGEDLTPFELAYEHIKGNATSEVDEIRLTILGEEAKVAEVYHPEKLSPHAMEYTEHIMEDV